MSGKYIEIQNAEIKEHEVTLRPRGGSTCWKRRTHAHVKERVICKWDQHNSMASTFTLLHEIGHIVTKKSWMRRVESEYAATQWAADECRRLGLVVPPKIREGYQSYIDRELDRGIRRGGKNYAASYNVQW